MEEVRVFYSEVLGFEPGPRPSSFTFEGHWLYSSGKPLIHLTGLAEDPSSRETGHLSHIALTCEGVVEMTSTLKRHDIDYRINTLEELDLIQIFFKDPCDITVELNFFGEPMPEGA